MEQNTEIKTFQLSFGEAFFHQAENAHLVKVLRPLSQVCTCDDTCAMCDRGDHSKCRKCKMR